MKKLVFFAFIFIIIYFSFQAIGMGQEVIEESNYQVIPDEAIRLRILANSDDEEDQHVKRAIRDDINGQITRWVESIDDIDEARELIQDKIPEITETAKQTAEKFGVPANEIHVDFDKNVPFPVKLYGSFIYPAGEYEAILVTIGEGKGANWWCVLFPPLCFLDFSNGALVADDSDSMKQVETEEQGEAEEPVKVTFFLFKWFGWT